MKIALLGDVHGSWPPVQAALQTDADLIVQLGDFGFADSYLPLRDVDPDRLKIVGGNHDEYPALVKLPHYLGDFGMLPGTKDVFFVRGASSIDKHLRVPGLSWWPEEELPMRHVGRAVDHYQSVKPSIVLSHDAPGSVARHMLAGRCDHKPSSTSVMLDLMFGLHKPKFWFFGHHHCQWTTRCDGTTFRCLNIGEVFQFDYPGLVNP